jgi:hypothetical protein
VGPLRNSGARRLRRPFPALQGEFIWDDGFLAQANPFIKSPLLIFETFRHNLIADSFFCPLPAGADHFPTWSITSLEHESLRLHLSNVLLHVACGIVLYFLLQQLFGAIGARWLGSTCEYDNASRARGLNALAFIVALLWIVHPVHSAAIDYVSGRADSLAFFFAGAGWLLYLRGRAVSHAILRGFCYTAAAGSCFLALCSRESAMMWVLLFLRTSSRSTERFHYAASFSFSPPAFRWSPVMESSGIRRPAAARRSAWRDRLRRSERPSCCGRSATTGA